MRLPDVPIGELARLHQADQAAHYAFCFMTADNITAHQKRTVWGCLTDEQKKLIEELVG